MHADALVQCWAEVAKMISSRIGNSYQLLHKHEQYVLRRGSRTDVNVNVGPNELKSIKLNCVRDLKFVYHSRQAQLLLKR